MKILTLCISLFLLTGCLFGREPAFKVNDCLRLSFDKELERWERKKYYYHKVLEVGKNKYRTVYVTDEMIRSGRLSFMNDDMTISMAERLSEKIECPTEFIGLDYFSEEI